MRKARLCALFLMALLLFTACTANKTAHSYPEGAHTHVYGNRYDVVPATCREAGTVVRYCKICHGEVTEAVAVPEDIAARAHAFSDTVVAPTEATEGYTDRTCTRCGYVVAHTDVVPARYALLADATTVTSGLPAGALALAVSDTASHHLDYAVGTNAALSGAVVSRLAAALTVADGMAAADMTADSAIPYGTVSLSLRVLLTWWLENGEASALSAIAVAEYGSEAAFAAAVEARLARLGVSEAISVDLFGSATGTATVQSLAVLTARVLDEPLLAEIALAAIGIEKSVAFLALSGKSPALLFAEGGLHVSAVAEGDGYRFAVLLTEGAANADHLQMIY